MSKRSFENIFVATMSTLTSMLATKIFAKLSEVSIDPGTLVIIAWVTFLAVLIFKSNQRDSESIKSRMDLLFRVHYQTGFLQEIARDDEEKMLYKASLLRKLHDLADFKAEFGNDGLSSFYIGCLAFCANEKRANIPWVNFAMQSRRNSV